MSLLGQLVGEVTRTSSSTSGAVEALATRVNDVTNELQELKDMITSSGSNMPSASVPLHMHMTQDHAQEDRCLHASSFLTMQESERAWTKREAQLQVK